MSSRFPNGSEWRKWDLHIHTPSSFCSEYGGDTNEIWEKFIVNLEELSNEIKVIGINDYIFLDGYKEVINYKRIGRLQNIELILPVVELRIQEFVGSKELNRINYHIIFADENLLKTEIIESHFLAGLRGKANLDPDTSKGYTWGGIITKDSLTEFGKHIYHNTPVEKRTNSNFLEIGFNNVNFELSKIAEILGEGAEPNSYLKDKYLKAIGKSEWEEFRWESSPARKITVINDADFVFSASPTVSQAQKGKDSLKNQNVNNRLLHCSDSHRFGDSSQQTKPKDLGHCFTWIKADPTFSGLKQVLNEPDRVFIGEQSPIEQRIKENKTKYIKNLSISNVDGYDGKHGDWFNDIEIPFNPSMVAIIGNKGSGKSAISDILGLCGGYKSSENFSFLHEKKFNTAQGRISKNFEAKITFHSERSQKKNLNSFNSDDVIERVKYLPQGYFESITNELEIEQFRREIENVVFTHYQERENFLTFQDLIERRKKRSETEIDQIKLQLEGINEGIVVLEKKLNPKYKSEIENKIKIKKEEIDSLVVPDLVKNPDEDKKSIKHGETVSRNIEGIKEKIISLEKKIEDFKEEKLDLKNSLFQIQDVLDEINLKANALKASVEHGNNVLNKFDLKIEFNLTIDKDTVTDFIQKINLRITELNESLDENLDSEGNVTSLNKQLFIEKKKLEVEQGKLDEPRRLYQIYLASLHEFEKQKNLLIGDEEIQNTLKYFEREISFIEVDLQNEIKLKRNQRVELVKKIIQSKYSVIEIYREIKKSIDHIILQNEELLKNYPISIDAIIQFDPSFKEIFLSYINKKSAGTFQTIEGGDEKISKLIKNLNLEEENSLVLFLDSIIESLFEDQREDVKNPKNKNLEDQVKNPAELYNYLFGLDYLNFNYELMQGGKRLEQLSPGERGALLLIFFLLLDKDEKPIILDQPEDNLDNQSVADILVPFIKRAKEKRQIIIVTHNPNLAIVSDAEQVIYVEIDKENNNKFSFLSGSIEDREINNRIVRVLEGAMPAFKKRKDKYYE